MHGAAPPGSSALLAAFSSSNHWLTIDLPRVRLDKPRTNLLRATQTFKFNLYVYFCSPVFGAGRCPTEVSRRVEQKVAKGTKVLPTQAPGQTQIAHPWQLFRLSSLRPILCSLRFLLFKNLFQSFCLRRSRSRELPLGGAGVPARAKPLWQRPERRFRPCGRIVKHLRKYPHPAR